MSALAEAPAAIALLRWTLTGLAVLWAVLAVRRPRGSLLAGIALHAVAVGFWVASLGRPYGLFVDPAATARAVEVVAGADGRPAVVAGPAASGAWAAAARVVGDGLLVLPTVLPVVLAPALALAVLALRGRTAHGALAAALCLAFSTGDLDAVRGAGLLPGLWRRPEAGTLLLVAVPAVLLLLHRRPAAWSPAGGVLVLATAALARHAGSAVPDAPASFAEALLMATLDHTPWLLLATPALVRGRDAGAAAAAGGGALALLLASLGVPVDPWTGHAWLRLGLLLGAAAGLHAVGAEGLRLLASATGRPALAGSRLVLPAVILVGVPGAFLTWWQPHRQDAVAAASRESLATALADVADWIRTTTPRDAVVLAGPDLAPVVAVHGRRSVLRMGLPGAPPDDARRLRLERLLVGRRGDPGALLAAYPVTHLLYAPGEFGEHGVRGHEDVEATGRWVLRHRGKAEIRVYERVGP